MSSVGLATWAGSPAGAASTASISGVVFDDKNGNRRRDATEPAFDGAAALTAVSSSLGEYSFAGLAGGTYNVTVTPPAGYRLTTADPLITRVASGGTRGNVNVGLYRPTSAIRGVVFDDPNFNKRRGGEEAGVAGVQLLVTDGVNQPIFTTSG
jgi:hypothetical protein